MTNHLYITHRFKLNNETMEWLKGMQNMFTHHHGFEDPAFFKGEEYILCVCSHEKMIDADPSLWSD